MNNGKKRCTAAVATLLTAVIFALTFCGCAVRSDPRIWVEYFDTVSTLTAYVDEESGIFADRCSEVDALLGDYHRLLDIYREYDGTEHNLRYVNAHAAEAPVKVDERLMEVLLFGKQMHELTEGKTNIAMGSVLQLWHNCREEAARDAASARIPTASELAEAAKHTDINDLILDTESMTVYFADPQMSLDVGAIGKGFVAEKVRQLLLDSGADGYVLNLGGNLCLIGADVLPRVAIKNPDTSSSEPSLRLRLHNTSCVTSGNYERYFTVGGERYHHIIDPDTLMPSDYFASVSIITENAAVADALSTALFSMSYEDGARIAASAGVDVVWIYEDGSVVTTEGLRQYIIG